MKTRADLQGSGSVASQFNLPTPAGLLFIYSARFSVVTTRQHPRPGGTGWGVNIGCDLKGTLWVHLFIAVGEQAFDSFPFPTNL